MLLDLLKNVFLANFNYLQNEEKIPQKVFSFIFQRWSLKDEVFANANKLTGKINLADSYSKFVDAIIFHVAVVYAAKYQHRVVAIHYCKKGQFERQITIALQACLNELRELQIEYPQIEGVFNQLTELLTRIDLLPENIVILSCGSKRDEMQLDDVKEYLITGNPQKILRFIRDSEGKLYNTTYVRSDHYSNYDELVPHYKPNQIGKTNFGSDAIKTFDVVAKETSGISKKKIADIATWIPDPVCGIIAGYC